MLADIQVDVFVGLYPIHLFLILVHVCRAGISSFLRAEFLDHIAQIGIWSLVYAASKMDSALRTVVASEYRAVLNECDLESEPGCRHSRTHTGHASANHDKIVFQSLRPAVFQCLGPEFFQLLCIGRRHIVLLRSEPDGIAPAFKSSEVHKSQLLLCGIHTCLPGILPHPPVTRVPEYGFQSYISDFERELSGTFALKPGTGPVVGADIDIVFALGRKFNFSCGIFHLDSHSVCKQVRGTHQVHKLLVYAPSSVVLETLGLDKEACRVSLKRPY